ncbi:MAG: hypothetical protein WD509_00545 [Candidatus Paceibacterota bacterium]
MIQDTRTQKLIGVGVIAILIGFIGWYIARDFSLFSQEEKMTQAEGESIESLVERGDAEVKEIPVIVDLNTNTITQPELNRTMTMPDRFSPEAVTILEKNIATLKTQLQGDKDSFQAWSDLAVQYKIIDDFEGAREIWEYLRIAAKAETQPLINLGSLYHYELKEFEKSESAYQEAIKRDGTAVEAYTGLHELYRYSYKTSTTLAVDTLKEGIIAVPRNTDIRMVLASYYEKLGKRDEAKTEYEKARTIATEEGNTNLVTIINAAIENLK